MYCLDAFFNKNVFKVENSFFDWWRWHRSGADFKGLLVYYAKQNLHADCGESNNTKREQVNNVVFGAIVTKNEICPCKRDLIAAYVSGNCN